jgi:urea transport system substrate-binding protein
MGVVYKAHDPLIDRDVAIKVLAADMAANEVAVHRFLAEARAAGKLNHRNAVAIYEVGEEAGVYYLAMEFAPGGSVSARIERQGAFSVLEATRIAVDAGKGLAAAHAAGMVHRDVKPANLLFTADGRIKVADFGLAKPAVGGDRQLTQQGQVVGSPYFMSPEQCEARELDHRSDIYSLGATYYSLLTGANPYENEGSTVRVMYAHCSGEVLDPRKRNRAIPEACSAIIARATAKRPEDRYQSAEEMLADVEAVYATLSGAAGIALPSQSGTRSAISTRAVALSPAATPAIAHRRRNRFVAAGALLAVTIAAVTLAILWNGRPPTAEERPANGGSPASLPVAIPPSGLPIKVGVLQSLTGTMAASGSAVIDATLLAIDEVNRSGGVLGRPVEAVVRGGQSDVQTFAQQAEKLMADEKVCTIFGCWTSAGRKMVVPIVESHNNLLVYPVQYEGIEESPNVIYLGATPNQQIIPAAKWAYAFLNKRRFYLVGSDYVFPRMANEIIKDQLRELGAEVAGEAYRPLGSTEFEAIIAEIVAAKADCILNTINGDSNVAFFRELRSAGVRPEDVPTISFSIGEEELRHLNVMQMVGDYAAWNYFQSIDSEENRKFVERFRAKYGPQRVVTDPMEAAYFGVKLWAAAVTQANSTEPAAIRQAMRGQRMLAPGGEVRIDPATQHAFKTPRIGRISADGQFEVVWTAAKPESPEPYPASRSAEEWRAVLHDLYRSWGQQWVAPSE